MTLVPERSLVVFEVLPKLALPGAGGTARVGNDACYTTSLRRGCCLVAGLWLATDWQPAGSWTKIAANNARFGQEQPVPQP